MILHSSDNSTFIQNTAFIQQLIICSITLCLFNNLYLLNNAIFIY